MSEYGWSLEYASGENLGAPGGTGCPLAMALALYSASSLRYGNTPAGPTYSEQAMIEALRRKEVKK